eukprot:m.73525 g.73525  ORF g.73525 m.73525 type:complete len:120 (+) comp35842_c0_seq5:1346-1705(+)
MWEENELLSGVEPRFFAKSSRMLFAIVPLESCRQRDVSSDGAEPMATCPLIVKRSQTAVFLACSFAKFADISWVKRRMECISSVLMVGILVGKRAFLATQWQRKLREDDYQVWSVAISG